VLFRANSWVAFFTLKHDPRTHTNQLETFEILGDPCGLDALAVVVLRNDELDAKRLNQLKEIEFQKHQPVPASSQS